ncbi:MAG: transcription-repair coupling factor [Oscillospiraceae bacterium]|nr:transcription-repair coupling factor [Oscillospiraceae bacterium]
MDLLLSALREMPEYVKLKNTLEAGRTAALSGVGQVHRLHFAAALHKLEGLRLLIVCQDDLAASRCAQELSGFLGFQPAVLGTRELTLYDAGVVSRGWEHRRLHTLWQLGRGELPILVASLEAMSQRTMPKDVLYAAAIPLKMGASYDLAELSDRLTGAGYSRCTMVEGVGQFAIRGDIVDVFSPAYEQPVRAEFFGDELDAMGFFDISTQRRTENVEEAVALPVAETLPRLHPQGTAGLVADLENLSARQRRRRNLNEKLIATLERDAEKLSQGLSFPAADRYMALIYPEKATAMDYLSAETAVLLFDHGNLSRSARAREAELGQTLDGLLESGDLVGELCDFSASWEDFCEAAAAHPAALLDSFLASAYPEALQPKELLSITAKQLPSYGGSLDTAVQDLAYYQKNDFRTLVLCGSRRRGEILQQMLSEKGASAILAFPAEKLPAQGQILLTEGAIAQGMEYPSLHLAVLAEGQLNAPIERRKAKKKKLPTNRQKLQSFTDLSPGDLVVHEQHGIGRYDGIEQMRIDGVLKDYMKILYSGTDVLYVPATQLDFISKYIGGGEDSPVRLNRLGGDAWEKTVARAKKAAKDLAEDLIKLYAERARLPGYAFCADTPWQKEFEDAFEYLETDDQLRAIEEIKTDMERPVPMDRLLCGDVGFGKTEVALRAAMKCVMDGKQVAILVPTTVLAQQHYGTCIRRFGGYPVQIDVLSRFRTAQQQKNTLRALELGSCDIVIGTHKLLGKQVKFKDLGLLIVDEEQRFGVSHKERLKELSQGVDVLTLSATPIPRTLNMALSGIRDMSTIEEAPGGRYPIQTFVLEHDDRILDDAMRRELDRGGQVYYLHNRVETIERCAARIRERTGVEEIAVAHGKMGEEELGDIMQRMADGEIRILVCTTIIETGIDIPNVNTLIIEDADRLGLAQLHQLRGRVGRSSRHAFAYLTFRQGKVLTEVAEKRLNAIREYAEFGSGFKIAMRDLEIRGAGNLLGAEQSGHMMSVGYDLYLKLLEEAVLEEKGEPLPKAAECVADLNVAASIPKDYVESGEQRMDLYRRMAAVRTEADSEDLFDEVVDRYGEPPEGVRNLISIALLRGQAAAVGVQEITQKGAEIQFTLSRLNLEAVSAICADETLKGRVFFVAGAVPVLRLRMGKGAKPLRECEKFVEKLKAFSQTGEPDTKMS